MGRRARQLAAAMGQHPQFLQGQAVEAQSVVRPDAPAFPDRLQQFIRWQIAIHNHKPLCPLEPENSTTL
jgi:hypothetical protein